MCGIRNSQEPYHSCEKCVVDGLTDYSCCSETLVHRVRTSLKPEKTSVVHHQLRLHALKRFTTVLSTKGIKVRKHHRNRSGSALRTLTYDKELGAIAWDSHRFLSKSHRIIPIQDMLDVFRDGKLVWVKTLHMGEFGLETPLEEDAEVIFAALDVLLDARFEQHAEPFEGLRMKIESLRLSAVE